MMYRRHFKRMMDIVLSLSAIVALSPLLAVTALLISIFDPGPVIFRQARVGRNCILFNLYKFRSMPVNTAELSSDMADAIKLTWIGRLIRRTNIDELPQLANILKGEMSIVGPRPAIPSQQELLKLRKASGAMDAMPGLTGLAQISSFDGMSISQKAEFDGQYTAEIGFFRDLFIISKTFLYLLKPPPKY
jgi:O-antigen biosynthesis protein WbqP